MPVNVNPIADRVQLRVIVGTDPESGSPIYQSRSYSNVKPDVSDEDLYTVAAGLGTLMQDNLSDVYRHKSFSLIPSGE